MTSEKKLRLGPVFGLMAIMALAACNTVAGAGKDIEAGGEAITDTADDAKDAISN